MEMDYCKRMKEATSEERGELRTKWGEFSKENNHTSLSLEIKMSRRCVKRFNSSVMCFVACTELQQFHIVRKTIEMFPFASFSQGFLVFNTFLSVVFFHMVKRLPSVMCVRAEWWVHVGCNKSVEECSASVYTRAGTIQQQSLQNGRRAQNPFFPSWCPLRLQWMGRRE